MRLEIDVGVDPRTAFEILTRDIGNWWRRNTPYWSDSTRAVGIRFEPYVGGRFIEVYDLRTGEGFEIGRVTEWRPGERLRCTWRESTWPADAITELEIALTATRSGTRVSLEHRGWERLINGSAAAKRYGAGWRQVLAWYAEHAGARSTTP